MLYPWRLRACSLALLFVGCGASTEAELATTDQALSTEAGCFVRHLHEAMALNHERAGSYAALSDGRSRITSAALIASEAALLPVAAAFDARAYFLQRAGVPVMCDEFVSMDEAPPQATSPGPQSEPPALLADLDGGRMRDEAEQIRTRDGLPALARHLEQRLADLAPHGAYLCMTRHILESTLRAANLAPRHVAEARARGVAWLAPERLSGDFIRLQLAGLPLALALDRGAAPLHAQGVPIVCDDVPAIAPE